MAISQAFLDFRLSILVTSSLTSSPLIYCFIIIYFFWFWPSLFRQGSMQNSTCLIQCVCCELIEIGKVRGNLFQINGTEKKPMVLPDAVGAAVNLSEKVYVPVKEFPDVSVPSFLIWASDAFLIHSFKKKSILNDTVQFRWTYFGTARHDG